MLLGRVMAQQAGMIKTVPIIFAGAHKTFQKMCSKSNELCLTHGSHETHPVKRGAAPAP